jgi:predicted thioredoxin/glutaredoxin
MKDPLCKIFGCYIILLASLLFSNVTYSQITVNQYNADWNKANNVEWLKDLTDIDKVKHIDIAANPDQQAKHEIVVVPTIIIFKDGEEVKRYQADISFAMKATREELQEFIDELLMQDF